MKFLVAVDGSEESEAALEYAVEMALAADADLDVVHAVTPRIYTEDDRKLIEDMSEAEQRSEDVLEEARDHAEELGYDAGVRTESLYGDPVEVITSYSDGYDCLYVGHRGLSQQYNQAMGSVARELIARSPTSVTVVR